MSPRRRDFTNARSNAKSRSIPWALSFEEWAAVWAASGRYATRGRKRGQYQMDRINPAKGYAVGNVQIIDGAVNRTKDAPHGWVAKLTEAKVRRIRRLYKPRITTQAHLAKLFNVTRACIKAVVRRQNWKTV